MAQYGIIVRADGTVPFDEDLPSVHKERILGKLVSAGHTVTLQPDGTHKIADFNPATFQQSLAEKP